MNQAEATRRELKFVNDTVEYYPSADMDVRSIFERVQDYLDEILGILKDHSIRTHVDINDRIYRVAELAWEGWRRSQVVHDRVTAMANLMDSKHHDYGNKPLIKFGRWGFIIKMDQKLARLRNLFGKKELNEPVEDSWKDLLGYSVLFLLFEKGELDER